MKKKLFIYLYIIIFINPLALRAFEEDDNPWVPDPIVHDPVIMKENDTYYLFSTGPGLCIWYSKDFKYWKRQGVVFKKPPKWSTDAIPSFKGEYWAPDISYYKGQYYLYYAVSVFGKNSSCIGLVTNKTLNPNNPDYKWVDRGKILQSIPKKNNWNAIDPQLIVDDKGTPYMAFGSFWSGLQLVELRPDRMGLASNDPTIINIANRTKIKKTSNGITTVTTGNMAIEGAYIYKHGNYYYLFASIDYCCRGADSDYKVIIGRSKNIKGPYTDFSGNKMLEGGGSIIMKGNQNWYGVGHNSIFHENGKDYIVVHGYDANDPGNPPRLIIQEMIWEWPQLKIKDLPKSGIDLWEN